MVRSERSQLLSIGQRLPATFLSRAVTEAQVCEPVRGMLAARELLALVPYANDARRRRAIQDDQETAARWNNSQFASCIDPIAQMGLINSHGPQPVEGGCLPAERLGGVPCAPRVRVFLELLEQCLRKGAHGHRARR